MKIKTQPLCPQLYQHIGTNTWTIQNVVSKITVMASVLPQLQLMPNEFIPCRNWIALKLNKSLCSKLATGVDVQGREKPDDSLIFHQKKTTWRKWRGISFSHGQISTLLHHIQLQRTYSLTSWLKSFKVFLLAIHGMRIAVPLHRFLKFRGWDKDIVVVGCNGTNMNVGSAKG